MDLRIGTEQVLSSNIPALLRIRMIADYASVILCIDVSMVTRRIDTRRERKI